MKLKRPNALFWSTCVAVASLGCAAGAQAADDRGWFLGAGLGTSKATDMGNPASTVDTVFAANGITSSTSFGGSNTTGKLFGGYQFNRYFGLEGAYTDLGRFSGNSVISAPAPDSGSGTWEARNVWSFAAIGSIQIVPNFSAFGKLGLANSEVELRYTAPASGATLGRNSSHTKPLLGLGLKYDINRQFALRGEWERYLDLGDSGTTGRSDVNLWTVSVQYRF